MSAAVVDLRGGEPLLSGVSTQTSTKPDVETEVAPSSMSDPRRRRVVVLAAVLAVAVMVVAELMIGFATHESRQRHLAFEFTQSASDIGVGDALLTLQIPSISLNEIVVEGAAASELRSGPGHVEGSAEIGAEGNAVILGRKQRYGGPFGRLDEVEKGATVAVKTRDGDVRLYQVDSVERVKGSSATPVETTDEERLTLVTSGRGLIPDDRVVVTATARKGSTTPGPERDAGSQLATSAMDARPADPVPGGLMVWALIVGLLAVLVIVGRRLRARYSRGVTLVALAPVAALLAVMVLYSVDIVLPATW